MNSVAVAKVGKELFLNYLARDVCFSEKEAVDAVIEMKAVFIEAIDIIS